MEIYTGAYGSFAEDKNVCEENGYSRGHLTDKSALVSSENLGRVSVSLKTSQDPNSQ
jgi:hypothetical protein